MVKTSDTADPAPTIPTFEQALAELESIVAAMDDGRMPLQESLDAYKRGMELLQSCRTTLDAAERQIRILEDGKLRDFDSAANPEANGEG